jgi:NADH-quinone oxidoreductase subunit N
MFTVLMSIDYLRDHPLAGGDYYALVLLSTCGMILMAAANDLIVIFLALEIMSVAIYVLAGILRTDPRSKRGGAQVLLPRRVRERLPALRTAFLFGASGSTQLDAIGRVVAKTPDDPLVWLGSRSSSWASASRSRWCRSTAGRPTSTRAPRRRSPRSWRSA